MKKRKFLWYSDTHLNFAFPWTQYNFVSRIIEENPAGLIITGDIACGITLKRTLTFLAKKLEHIPIYFVSGNHDSYSISREKSANIIRECCKQYPNLIWVSDQELVKISDSVCFIGDDGWYDGRLGNPNYLVYNFDWIMLDEFRALKTIEEKLTLTRKWADECAQNIKLKLEKVLQDYKSVYIITHVPPWAEATRALGTDMEDFWLPYNTNSALGKVIEEVMKNYEDRNVIVLAGHSHVPAYVNVVHNIECMVQSGKYLGAPTEHNCLFI